MVKTTKKAAAKRNRSHEEKLIDSFLSELADVAIKTHSIGEVAEATRLSEIAVHHMRIQAKGSITSWMRLAMYLFEKQASDLPGVMEKIRIALAQKTASSKLDQKIADAQKYYSEDELYAWLELLVARHEIESKILKKR